jgi:hypothetical protein
VADTEAPAVSITSPASGTTYSNADSVSIAASASDNVGVTRVDFYHNGALVSSDTSSPYSTAWSFDETDNGSHTWQAAAYDAAGNSSTDSVNLTVDISSGGGDGAHQWSKHFGGSGADTGYATAIDANGNRIVAGIFQNTANFGGGSVSSRGFTDIFVAKYSPSGAHLWSRTFGGTGDDRPQAVAVDGNGNVLVAGYFQNTVNFGGGSRTSAGDYDIFLAKYSVAGEHLWSKRFGDTTDDKAYAVAVDSRDNVLVTGYFRNRVDFGGGVLSGSLGAPATFIAKYGTNGGHLWSRLTINTLKSGGNGIAVDASDNVVVSGYFSGDADFDSTDGYGNDLLSSVGYTDIYLAKYSAGGAYLWGRGFGGIYNDEGLGVAVDAATGNIAVTGTFMNSINFGGGNLASAGGTDGFLAQFSATGGYRWARRFGSSSNDASNGVGMNNRGELTITGSFAGSVNLGGGTLASAGGTDGFVAKYAENGAHLWSQRLGGSGADTAYAVAVDAVTGNATLTGYFSNAVNFGGGNLSSAGSWDAFLLDLGP